MELTYELLVKNGFMPYHSDIEHSKLYRIGNNYYIELLPKLIADGNNTVNGFEIFCIKYKEGTKTIINQLNLTKLKEVDQLLSIFKILDLNIKIRCE